MQQLVPHMMPRLLTLMMSGAITLFAANTAGTLDPAFGKGGVAAVNLGSRPGAPSALVALQTDGSILALAPTGSTGSELFRFTSASALDHTLVVTV